MRTGGRRPAGVVSLVALAAAATVTAISPSVRAQSEPSASAETAAAPAPGPCDGPETSELVICLKDGSVLRGKLVDVSPEGGVMMRAASGPLLRVDWRGIAKIRYAAESTEPTAPPAPALPAPVPPPALPVFVHVDGPDAAVLQIDATGDDGWKNLCHLPCDRSLPADGRYRISGSGLRDSVSFKLGAPAGGRSWGPALRSARQVFCSSPRTRERA